jgi:hypothetical protein
MLSYLVNENYAIYFLMLIATCVQHGIFMYSNNTQRLSIDVPNVGYAFGWNGDCIKRKKNENFLNDYDNLKWSY